MLKLRRCKKLAMKALNKKEKSVFHNERIVELTSLKSMSSGGAAGTAENQTKKMKSL
jgi:hypothetical protein